MNNFRKYRSEIRKATTQKQLFDISFRAYMQDGAPIYPSKKNTLSNKVNRACTAREIELGLLKA